MCLAVGKMKENQKILTEYTQIQEFMKESVF
jgi:hypothetical protein